MGSLNGTSARAILSKRPATTARNEFQRILTGKPVGVRKFNLIQTVTRIGRAPGRRRTGYFAVGAIDGTHLADRVNIKTKGVRLTAPNIT